MNIKISKLEFFMLLSTVLEHTKAFNNICDKDGYLIVPQERLEHFYIDMGLVVGRVLDRICKPE